MRSTQWIDWNRVWNRFDKWFSTMEEGLCHECGRHRHSNFPDWEEQQKQIQKLVDGEVRRLRKGV